jgi:hypothetical protein
MAEKFFIVVGALFVAYGLIGLIGVWLVPAIGNLRLYSSAMLTGSLATTRSHRTLMALSCALSGVCTASLSLGVRVAISVFILAILLWASAGIAIWYRHSR